MAKPKAGELGPAVEGGGVREAARALAEAVLEVPFEEGRVLLPTGSSPAEVRLRPRLNATGEELEEGCFTMLEKAVRKGAEDRELPC